MQMYIFYFISKFSTTVKTQTKITKITLNQFSLVDGFSCLTTLEFNLVITLNETVGLILTHDQINLLRPFNRFVAKLSLLIGIITPLFRKSFLQMLLIRAITRVCNKTWLLRSKIFLAKCHAKGRLANG